MSKITNRYSGNLICEDALLQFKQLASKNRANLEGAKINDKKIINYKEIANIGNNNRQLRCFLLNDNSFYFMAGCFGGNEKELEKQVMKKYGQDCEYMEAIKFLKKISKKYVKK